jgi:asparagine synthase (glutamine-hydrolysing)
MCGVFGIIGPLGDTCVGEADAGDTQDILAHRGPDDYGSFTTSCSGTNIYVDHTRLSIIGLGEQGHQPFLSEDESKVMSYNGEIYNYKEMKNDLSNNYDCKFKTDTDTEVLLKCYEVMGIEDTLDRLVGIFAFSIVDLEKESVYLARDHMGVKPMYYINEESLIFSSEIKSILNKGGITPQLNHDVLGEYFANFWVYEPDTLFEGVYKLECGHYITYDIKKKELEKRQYWDIINEKETKVYESIGDDIKKVVEDQLVSDVPVGMYLSGGIDSSVIAYHASRQEGLRALNLRNNEERSGGEYRNLKRLEDKINISIGSFAPETSMVEVYKEMVYHMDEPVADPAIIPANLLANEAQKRGIKVMLSGMGGDELFAGYRRMKILSKVDWLKYFYPFFLILYYIFPVRKSKMRRNLKRVANFLSNPTPSNYFSLSYYFSKEDINRLVGRNNWFQRYTSKIQGLLKDKDLSSIAQKCQYLDIRGYLSSHNLIYMDKASMADSVEVRVPLLDHRFAKKYFNLPLDAKVKNGLKTPLRQHVKEILGSSFVGHKKQGFSFPITEHVEGELRSEMECMLNDGKLSKVINTEYAFQVLKRHYNGDENNEMKIWAMYTLGLWIDEFDVVVE